ncbi:MAG: aspartate aminotransferase family protein [Acidimicrobiia bacterium]|nr:aspartate aminotransferase family protein [Acidimicrobiia bacterium]
MLERAAALLPACALTPTMSLTSALVVREGRGSRITDMSGNEYIDYLLGSGPMLLGHAHPAVVAAVNGQVGHGTSFLLPNEPSILLAEEIVRAVPCAERVAFCSTGSDSVFFALRLARAHRRCSKVLKFEGAYHGQSDAMSMSNQWTRDPAPYPSPVPNSEGIPESVRDDVLVAPFNDLEATAKIVERHAPTLAAVIVEPLQRTIPPAPGFLEGLRDVTAQHGIPLVFDEVVTGFRLAYGGAQAYYGVVPDLCALGKSVSGGHPIGIVCGSGELMRHAEGIRRLTGGYVAMTGTFSGNPVSCAVGLAVLEQLRAPGVYEELFSRGNRLMTALQSACDDAGVPARVTGEPPAFEVWFTDRDIVDFRSSQHADPATHMRFSEELLDRGVLKAHEKFFVSTAHTDSDVELTIEAMRGAVSRCGSRSGT